MSRLDLPGHRPFWAITKHADIREVSTQPRIFANGESDLTEASPSRIVAHTIRRALRGPLYDLLCDVKQAVRPPREDSLRFLLDMDPPEHRAHAHIAMRWLVPRALQRMEGAIARSARRLVDELAARSGQVTDFVEEAAARHPAHAISRILGLPEEDDPYVVRVANEWFGADDPEFRRHGPDKAAHYREVTGEFIEYISHVVEDRRRRPRDDLASDIANARVNGRPLGRAETLAYYLILFTAGHETTRNAISGGLLALSERPDELDRLRRHPEHIPIAVDEMMRWTSPVNFMTRRAVCDYVLRGERIREGDRLVLFYASANRDPDIFEAPDVFRPSRRPNPHLAFGVGEHFCMGAKLAQKTSTALFTELLPRLETLELAEAPARVASYFVAGIKHLPIRHRIRPAEPPLRRRTA